MPVVVVLCTGNVARSPALAALLHRSRPDLKVLSAAIGVNAKNGRLVARPMRNLLTRHGLGDAAQHRSQRWDDLLRVVKPNYVVAVAQVHLHRLSAEWRERALYVGPIPDPAFGGEEAYERVWPMLEEAADRLATTLIPRRV
jgi:protein-tyrosine-phosphatase